MEDLAAVFDPQGMFDFPDPYPLFAELRRTSPVTSFQFLNRLAYVVTRYDDVRAVLQDGETYSSRANAEVGRYMGRTLEALVPTIEALAHERVDRLAGDGRADLVAQFSLLFPLDVIAGILGLTRSDHAQFQRWSLDLIAFSKDPSRAHGAAERLREYFLPFIRLRRDEPRADVISRLVTGTVSGVGLTDDEVVSFLRLLLPAGAETTSRLLGSMLYALLTERERLARVDADRSLMPWAIEETLRWETPVVFVARQTTRPVEIAGTPIPSNTMVSTIIGSANRDETHFDDPDTSASATTSPSSRPASV
ncbi:MAG: cytochrome P450 [Deltaproteobacteria bacterium]|nr:MAG: cytochrome P450 [Deltaproteobacteria bacterium]